MRSVDLQVKAGETKARALIGGRYRVEAALGHGGAARLYRVIDSASGRILALKLLQSDTQPKLRELFELEYQTLASLDHPRTPRVFDFGRDSRGLFYTMELLEGSDLSASAPLPWRSVVAYLRDASQALGLLHARRLIHRDVSPRNLWRTPDGRVKLIDFGALAPFGRAAQVVGTPPLVPPEALAQRALDQRADLYALGGVAYFLLTGRYAYPARSLSELPDLWRYAPPAPSRQEGRVAEAIPPELDALVLALLDRDELVRPSSTAEVIDRIDALCATPCESEREAALAQLSNAQYVGRVRERRQLARRFALAAHGRGQVCVIESLPGGGRSRALRELELAARVWQSSVLFVNAAAHVEQHGVAAALALALLDAAPERAKSAAQPYAALLAHLSVPVCERLDAVAAPPAGSSGELRVRVQEAERDWFLAVAEERPLVVLVDNLECADASSAAFLLSLALQAARSKVLLVCTLVRDRARQRSAALRALAKASQRIVLPPLTAAELHDLLQSLFGTAEHLSRLSGRLFELTRGNPGYALELLRELVQREAITFDSGTWLLPSELTVRGLSSSREQALTERLSRVSAAARELARLLSVHSGPLAPGLCRALAAGQGSDLLPHLGELLRAEILVPSGSSLLFAHDQLRQACSRELTEAALRRAHSVLAQQLMAAPTAGTDERLQAGVHLVAADDARGPALVVQQCLQLFFHEVDKLVGAAPAIETALALLRARGCSRYTEGVLLSALVLAGYEGERRYLSAYDAAAVRTLAELLGLHRARKWRTVLGGKLALSAALASSALTFLRQRNDPCAPSFVQALHMLVTAVAASAGACSIGFDPDGAARFAEVLQPFAALGPNQLGCFMYEFCQTIAESSRDRVHIAEARWRALLECIDHGPLFAHEPEAQRRRARGGALFGIAIIETLRDSGAALRSAQALDRNGQELDHVCANQVRMVYYGSRGDMAAYERYRERAEHHAIARGTTWQVETWMPGPASAIALNLHDALAAKSASEHMTRMAEQSSVLEIHARHMRGVYLLLREKYVEALPCLEGCLEEAPGCRTAWARSHGVLARAYNRLGEHARAYAACARVFEHYTDADFEYANLNLIVETESIVAEAGLGRLAEANERLQRLHVRHAASDNPLLCGQLFETGLELALFERDVLTAREQLARIERLYRPLAIPSLAQHCQRLSARVELLAGGARTSAGPLASQPMAAHAASTERPRSPGTLHTGQRLPLAEQAMQVLQRLADSAQASAGALFIVAGPGSPQLGATLTQAQPSTLVRRWVSERLARERERERTALHTEVEPADAPWNVLHDGELTHRLLLLTAEGVVVGLAVLGRVHDAPESCPVTLLRAVADDLYESLCEKTVREPLTLAQRPG